MVELSTVKNKPSEEVITTLERMLEQAKRGEIHQICYVAYIENDRYIQGSAGKVNLDVHTEFGMLMDLAMEYRENRIVSARFY